MSSEAYVRVRGLGKKFKLYDHPWQHLAEFALGISGGRDHWALRGIDLDLAVGDCIGVVGRNGAGKSTLLELICGILKPSEGVVETQGRIAALLQLGAGFNPEFTGRENVFLGGALYGLTTQQIEARFAEIEDFAGIGEYIDRPVREYSSGMYARLAFSVCAHVDADILVVDEILGVGDVRFQQKSMRFLRAFRKRGIVLFVSHNEHAVAALCRSAIWVERGTIAARGTTKEVLYRYRREMSRLTGPGTDFLELGLPESPAPDAPVAASAGTPPQTAARFDPDDAPAADGAARIETVELASGDEMPFIAARGGEIVSFSVTYRAERRLTRPHVCFTLRNPMGQVVFAGDSRDFPAAAITALDAGAMAESTFRFRLPFLPTANYPVEVFLLSEQAEGIACHAHLEAASVIQMLSRHVSDGAANIGMDHVRLLVGAEVGAA